MKRRTATVFRFGLWSLLPVLVVLLIACARETAPPPSPTRALTPSETAAPTASSTPAAVPPPSDTAEPSLTPEPTVTRTPTDTPRPSPTIRPSPTPQGTYGDPENGWAIQFPSDWAVTGTEDDFPSLVVTDPDSGIMVVVGWQFYGEDESLEGMAEMLTEAFGQGTEGVTGAVAEEIALRDGTPAYSVVIASGERPRRTMQVVLAQRGARVYIVVVTAPTATYEGRARTIESVIGSLTLTALRPYDVDRDTALVLAGGEPYDLDPATTESGAPGYVGYLFRGLVVLNTDLQVVPDLAERWEISDDGRTYTFFLHPDAVFHNGKPVTAADVKYSWERAADTETDSIKASTYLGDIVGVREMLDGGADEISGVVVLDEHMLQVTIDEPKVYFLAKLTLPVAFVVDRENVEAGDEDDWWREPNGSGPFRLAKWEDDVLIFDRNESFYRSIPKLEHVVHLIDAGPSSRLYESGDIDVTGVSAGLLDRVGAPTDPLHDDLHTAPSLCTSGMILDVSQPPFDDPLVRQAFSYAVDRDQYVEVVLKGAVEPAFGPLPPGMPGYTPDLVGYGFDPDRARELIAQSSYGEAANLPALTVTEPGYSEVDSDVAALIESWEEVFGIEIEVELLEPFGYLEELREHHGHIFSMGWCADYPDPQNFLDVLYHSESEENLGLYSNPEVDALLEEARIERDPEARLAQYQQVQQMIVDDAAEIWLSHSVNRALIKPYVHGLVTLPLGVPQIEYVYLDPH